MMQVLSKMLIAVLIILIFVLSWIKNSLFTNLSVMPTWLGIWCDEYPRFRTAVPFFFLSILVICLERKFFKYLMINCTLVIFVELTQLFLPTRHCDIYDMLWGCSGVIAGLLLGQLLLFFQIIKSK